LFKNSLEHCDKIVIKASVRDRKYRIGWKILEGFKALIFEGLRGNQNNIKPL